MGLPAKLLPIAFVVSLGGSFHFGFQLVMTNPTQEVFRRFVNASHFNHYGEVFAKEKLDALWSMIVAVVFAGALTGSFILRWAADRLGRKSGLLAGLALAQLAVIMSILSYTFHSYELYAVSRFLLGIAISINMGLGAMYLVEICPKSSRGKLGMVTGTMVQAGTVAGSVVALPQLLGTDLLWPYIYGFELACMVIPFCALLALPESPSYMVRTSQPKAARKAFVFFHSIPEGSAENLVEELATEMKNSSQKVSMLDIFRNERWRKRVFVGCVVAFVMAFSGIAIINGYAVEILINTGLSRLEASLANVGFNVLSLIAIWIGAMIVDRFGRRPLLLTTTTGILVTNVIMVGLMAAYTQTGSSIFGASLVVLIGVFTLFFAAGPGPLTYFVSAELVETHARSAAQAWTSVVQMGSRTLLLSIYLPLKNVFGNSITYLGLFVAPVLISIFILYFRLPETKNKTPKEIDEAEKKLPLLCGSQPKPEPQFV